MYQNLNIGRGQVFHLLDFYLSLLTRFHDGVAQAGHRLTVRKLANSQRLIVHLLYLCTDPDAASSLTIVVL